MAKPTNDEKKSLLHDMQSGFPLVSHPFQELGGRHGMSESAAMDTVTEALETKYVRNLGPVFDPRKLGYTSTLAAAEVEGGRIVELAAALLEKPSVTHNYLRENQINIWFTITARTSETIDGLLKWVSGFPGVARVLNLPVVTVYKINAVFGSKTPSLMPAVQNDEAVPLTDKDIALVRTLQQGIPVTEQPFYHIAESVTMREESVIDILENWLKSGVMRRIGVRLNHRRAGYSANVLAVWGGDNIDTWGQTFARMPEVSHCYRRATHPDWPYELYTMVHAPSEEAMSGILEKMSIQAPGARRFLLKSLYELKKTTMLYFTEDER